MPPPIIKAEAFFSRFSRTPIFDDTFAPPIIATIGLGGLWSMGSRFATSFSINSPPTAVGTNLAIVAVLAWAL